MISIRRIDHVQVSVPVGSEDAVRAFYCGLLGLREIPKPPELRARGGLWVECGNVQMHFGAEDVDGREQSKRHVGLEVDDLGDARRTLEAAGVAVTDGVQPAGFRRIELRDPFGNRIELLQRT